MTSTPDDVSREETPPSPEPHALLETPNEEAPPPPAGNALRVPLSVPVRTLPLFGLFIAIGVCVLAFTYLTVHRRQDLAQNPSFGRVRFTIESWLESGYFHFGGLLVRPNPKPPGYYFYLSSTGGHLVSAFLVERIFKAITGRTSMSLLALHSQIVTLLVAALLGLLAFRLARRIGTPPLHALVLAASLQVVHFTFPDNLALFWEISGRQPFLLFALLFLLIEERCVEVRTRRWTIAQGVAAFLLTYMEYTAGAAFLGTYLVIHAVLAQERLRIGRLLAVTIVPAVLALSLFGLQRAWVASRYPDVPTYGATFLFRTGLDGSTQYYGSHLDIAYGRDLPRRGFPPNSKYLFRWKWLFFAGTTALVTVLLFALRGRVPTVALISLLSLLGCYLLYAALFSQAFVIHPYLFDVLLYTPLVLALFVLAPALFESIVVRRGVIVAAIFFLAAWVTMVQLRDYAMWYPLPPPPPAPTAR